MKITINNRDMCRVGSMFLHVVGTNPERETIIGAGSEQILDVFDGGEAINIICAAHDTEEVLVDGVMTRVNIPKIITGRWFDPNLPQQQESAQVEQSKDVAGQGGTYQVKESTVGANKPGQSGKVNLTNK